MADSDRLRALLGESIPAGGTAADTFFLDADITDLLTNFRGPKGTNMYLAAAEGWERKASSYADLVDVVQGGSQRRMSETYDHAKERAEHFLTLGLGRKVTQIGKIQRAGTTIR